MLPPALLAGYGAGRYVHSPWYLPIFAPLMATS